ncbi:amino acid ABC transporter permease [Pseudochrobactrum asaccharolyticum]|jgi:polar amino acid transport system permease protein|uniref:Amino acid ABC transporter membrane protein 1 (PAAT family) n=1 Tax=Pseudochrobactrum asaccharolyticum TaxID=354351 RepID=A0A366E085_9HYPH|nr:amino acid ABC transporter permease [Pseudochrobactrum asaccharolyticum]MBX8800264.1 amino acid ABC transporter permease [Ochrobactrum sp. MR28]MBX8815876.1 amino acid ABC transporter permease [Ochrobactrum sp. MR31]MCF7672708.1 amino acid ABC transporter permease [Bacillus subtilis]MCF7646569.1 amino acid ABC transporter permease [Pseudochrobactrum asaccharolyticum]RBO95525.1 amino acid ABC transporter membrane protein 1 (PAAT family) [Pseudochrobactrum asaccharolyticum]
MNDYSLAEFLIRIAPTLGRGALVSIQIALVAAVGAMVIGFITGLARLSPHWYVRLPFVVYVELFRSTSSLVQIFYFFYVLPLVGIKLDAFLTGTLVLSLNFGAYVSEVVRSAVQSVSPGQWQAGIALNMERGQIFRRIIFPQAVPVMLPALGNYALELLKATSLVSLITITELTFAGSQLVQFYGRPTTIYLAVFVIYLIMAMPLVALNNHLEKRAGGIWQGKVRNK